jgi:hypothetical protein
VAEAESQETAHGKRSQCKELTGKVALATT